jgi:hypothetical protein
VLAWLLNVILGSPSSGGATRTPGQGSYVPSTEMLAVSTPARQPDRKKPQVRRFCAPGRIRTRDPLLRRQLLYPTELQALRLPIVADEGHMLATLRAEPGYSERIKFTLFMDI